MLGFFPISTPEPQLKTSVPWIETCGALALQHRGIPSLLRVVNTTEQVVFFGIGGIGAQRAPERTNRGICLAVEKELTRRVEWRIGLRHDGNGQRKSDDEGKNSR